MKFLIFSIKLKAPYFFAHYSSDAYPWLAANVLYVIIAKTILRCVFFQIQTNLQNCSLPCDSGLASVEQQTGAFSFL